MNECSGIEHSIGRWFRAILEMSSREKVFSIGSDRDLWNPIVNKDVTKAGRADRDSGKVMFLSSKKLLMEEF